MKHSPILSIITPCDPNRAQFLSETAQSVEVLRKFVPLEWIIVLDGKPPASFDASFCDVLLEHSENRGVSAARNTGLSEASGTYITPLDADDNIVAGGIVASLQELSENPTIGWVASNRVDLDTAQPTKHWHGRKFWEIGQLTTHKTKSPSPFHPNGVVMRRSLAVQVGGWDERFKFGEDFLFIALCSEYAAGLSIIDIGLEYRQWDNQTIQTLEYSETKDENIANIITEINKCRQKEGRTAL